jgi:hypothetical protein
MTALFRKSGSHGMCRRTTASCRSSNSTKRMPRPYLLDAISSLGVQAGPLRRIGKRRRTNRQVSSGVRLRR